jgi:osmotically-inducible protein OsmY
MKLWLSWSRNASSGSRSCEATRWLGSSVGPTSFRRWRPLARETADTLPSDAALRELVLAEIDKQTWSPGLLINVIVRDGVVELWGTILDERKRQALRVVAENVPGTKQVKDHLVSVEPMSGMVFEAPDQGCGPIANPG